jgi:hypothetical protein
MTTMPTLDDRIHALVLKLTELSQAGGVTWSSISPQTFSADLPSGNSVTIESSRAGYPYSFTLHDALGEAIERIDSLGPEDPVGPWDRPLRALYQAARASALNISGTVNQMLQDIGVDPASVPAMAADSSDDDIPF